jgi:hypothetical protein
MSSPEEKEEARKARKRENARRRRANLSEEDRRRERMYDHRMYYIKRGTIPAAHTAIGRWCAAHGYDVAKVMSGEQPI